MIDYYLIMHTVTRISSFGGHTYTVPLLEEAVMLQNRVDQKKWKKLTNAYLIVPHLLLKVFKQESNFQYLSLF